ncbi:MAG: NERD domain-containing protein [Deltaproteobacteria bacterium]|nr:NERD domain-containing protein [Deltaproteobacteria bacterium]
MKLAASRIVTQGETPHAHEREAIEFAIHNLPNSDPFHLWALLELLDPSTGRLHEIDLLVLGRFALYLVEVKSGPGKYEGDTQDWWRTAPGEDRPRYLQNPFRLTNHKSKILASRLRTKMRNPKDAPFIQPLVFLSAPAIELRFRNFGDNGVVTRETFKAAMQFGRFPGADERQRPKISEPVTRDVAQAIAAIGLKPRKGKMFVGAYELGSVLVEGSGFQDRSATHRDNKSFTRRARIYTVSQASSVERRQQLRRAADREAQLLYDVREYPSILRIADYVTDAELGREYFETMPCTMSW